MSFKSEMDYVTGVYRCKDPIKNFKIKVKLQQDKSTLIPLPHFGGKNNGEAEENVNEGIEWEEKVITWQEKVFSPSEIDYYSYIGNCQSPLEEKYHHDISTLCKDYQPSNRIFTYTDADDFNEYENDNHLTTEDKPTPTYLVRGMTMMQLRKRNTRNKKVNRDISYLNRRIVDYAPSVESKKKGHYLMPSFQTFYILADLSIKDSPEKEEEGWLDHSEYVLCVLKYDAESDVLFVTPDFNTASIGSHLPSYYLEVDGDSRNVYRYWLENASESILEDDEEKEETILAQLLDRHLDLRQIRVGIDFDIPRSNELKMLILGEIVCAEEFEYDDLFVHFLYELPNGWSCENQQELTGVTQKCHAGGSGMVYFGHLFETNLTLNIEALPKEADSVPCWPQLFAEVLSFDSWGRFRVEGYCFTKIPPSPGQHCLELPTWRPLTDEPSGELRRFFVGGSPGLEDLSSVGIPATFEGNHLSKLGLKVTSSGTLHLRLHIIHQSNPTGSDSSSSGDNIEGNKSSFLLERLSATSLVNSVNAVMAAFKRARERMLRAREGLDLS